MPASSHSQLILDAILQAELPQRLSLDLMVTHAAVAERLARGEDREDLLLSFCECLDLALEGWSPMVILDLGNGSIAVGNAHCTKEEAPGLLSVLDQLPDLETIYPVGKLSVESDRWLTACPQRTVKHFGCFRVGKTGLLVFTSNQANRLDQTELTTARLIAEAMAFVADYEAPAASVHRQAPDRIVKSPDPGDLLSQASCRTALSEILQEAVCLLNDTGEVIHVNEAATRMLGVPQDRLIGKPLQPFAVGSESVTFIKGLHTHADTQTHSICLRQEPNNDSIWVDARTQSIEVDGDQPAQTILVLRDKSLEKGLEEQLEDSKEQLKAVTASPSLLMFRVDRRGAVISAEGGFMEQAQLKENDLVGRNAMGFCQDSATRRRLWRQLRRDGEASAGIETEFGFLKVTLAATLGPNRKPHTVHGLAVKSKVSTTEATALPVERIVEKIVEKPIYIEAPAANPPPAPQPLCPSWIGTLHALGDALVMIDAQGVIRFINLAAERMLACQQSEVIGLPFLHLGTFGDTDPLNTFLVEPQPLGAIHQVRLQRHDGVMLEIGLAGAPITDGQNQIQGFVLCCCADQSGEALTDGERQIMERENFKALSTFAGGIAHDLNNILTSLIGNVSLANMLVMDVPEASERLVEAERACFRAKDLSHQLLTFAKGSTPVKKDTGLDDLIQQCAELYLRGAKAVSRIISKPGLWSVNIDEGQISQVLENLILNADHSMPHGGTVTLSSENFHYSAEQGQIKLPLEEGLYVRISVLDEGAGIPEDQLAHIFKPYHTSNESGRGLGLATTFTIVKNHRGFITASSRMGKGTEFAFYLPATGVIKQPKEEVVLPRSDGKNLDNGRVLVIDDEKSIRDLATATLNLMGCDVVSCPSSSEGVQRFIQSSQDGSPFDLVIMDLTIPGDLGGNEAMQQILSISPKARGIASSGYSEGSVMAHYRDYGFQAALSKPYNIADLQRVVATMLAG